MPAKSPKNSTKSQKTSAGATHQHKLPLVGAGLFAILLPVFLILFNTSYITNSEWLYDYGWWRNDIANRTGLTTDQLNRGADQIKEYFGNDAELLDLRVDYAGREVSLYKEREVLHMVDVKALMQAVFAITRWSGVALLLLLAVGSRPSHAAYLLAQFDGNARNLAIAIHDLHGSPGFWNVDHLVPIHRHPDADGVAVRHVMTTVHRILGHIRDSD